MKRLLACAALAVVLAAGMLGVSGARQVAAAAAQPSQTCVLGIICLSGGSSSPTSSPSSAPTGSPTASPSPTSASPSPTPSASATGPSPSASSTPAAGPTASGTPSAAASPSATASPSGTAQPKKATAKRATAAAGLVASIATGVLTAGSATMTGFTYQGNVDMPTAGGTVTMMKFTADSITLDGGVTYSVTQGGVTTVTSSPTLAFSGGVTLYATQLSGTFGVPLTFTPSTASAVFLTLASALGVLLGSITLTNVTTDQPLVVAGSLQTGALSMEFGG